MKELIETARRVATQNAIYENTSLYSELADALEAQQAEIELLREGIEAFKPEAVLAESAKILNERDALAEQVMVLRGALAWVQMVFTDDTLTQERDPELWMPSVEEALATGDVK